MGRFGSARLGRRRAGDGGGAKRAARGAADAAWGDAGGTVAALAGDQKPSTHLMVVNGRFTRGMAFQRVE